MSGYLAVTDERTLTPAGVKVVSKDFPLRSEIVSTGEPLPQYATGTEPRQHSWRKPFYNTGSQNTARIRGGIVDSLMNDADYEIVFIGDSKTEGSGPAESKVYEYSYPDQLRRLVGGVEGFIVAHTQGASWDDRWTATPGYAGTTSTRMGIISSGTGSRSVTFVSNFAHTGATWYIHAVNGGTITASVDGGAGQDFTIPAGDGFTPITPEVSGDTVHTYVLTTTMTGVHIPGFRPLYGTPQLKFSRLARRGSSPNDWISGNYTAMPGTSLWETVLAVSDASAIFCQLGTNLGPDNAESAATKLGTVLDAVASRDVASLIIAPGGLNDSAFLPLYAAQWDAADRHDFPLVDFQSVIGNYATANALGLMADTVHESKRGYSYGAAALRALLT